MPKPTQNNHGFTLTEVLLAFLIGSIVILVCTVLLVSASNYFRNMETTNQDKLFGDAVLSMLKEELAYAERIQILEHGTTQTPTYSNVFKINTGRLYWNENDIYETIYSNQTVELQLAPQSGTVLMLTVTIKNAAGTPTYTVRQTFTANTMAAQSRSIEGLATGMLTNPVISYQKSGE